jgi:hypothetical protein
MTTGSYQLTFIIDSSNTSKKYTDPLVEFSEIQCVSLLYFSSLSSSVSFRFVSSRLVVKPRAAFLETDSDTLLFDMASSQNSLLTPLLARVLVARQ